MSNYRDDLVDVITVRADTTSKIKIMIDERISTSDRLGGANKDTLNEGINITDGMGDSVGVAVFDGLMISATVTDKKIRRELITEIIKVSDGVHRIYRESLSDNVGIDDNIRQILIAKDVLNDMVGVQDNNTHTIKDRLIDTVGISAGVDNNRQIQDRLTDNMTTHDRLIFAMREQINDTLRVDDRTTDKKTATNELIARIVVGDDVSEVFIKRSRLDDTVRVGDEIWDKLTARDNLHERAMIAVMGELIHDDDGMAWTMNTVNQAMSQYNPYNVNRLAVINGVLYGEGKDGIYRLDGADESMTAILITDKLDYGENLIKPSYAYTEYRTDGTMRLTVHTTQKGVAQAYTYALPKERADEMTNGRFVFGRGLYGRQFAYTLAITAKQALLHDLNIHFEQTRRRL